MKPSSMLALLAIAGGATACGSPGPAPRRLLVEMRQMGYSPTDTDIRPGDTLVWINRDIVPHTATADDRSWSTGQLARGDSARRIVTGQEAGYFCELHPAMKGRLNRAK